MCDGEKAVMCWMKQERSLLLKNKMRKLSRRKQLKEKTEQIQKKAETTSKIEQKANEIEQEAERSPGSQKINKVMNSICSLSWLELRLL